MTVTGEADRRIAVVRDSPEARRALLADVYVSRPPIAGYRRAAEAFMTWQLQRGLLNPPSGARPGSPWWRTVNERLLLDHCRALAPAPANGGGGELGGGGLGGGGLGGGGLGGGGLGGGGLGGGGLGGGGLGGGGLGGGRGGDDDGGAEPASVGLWRHFFARPSPAAWYRAHNASVVGGYVQALPLAWDETPAERFFMNVALFRVLFAHALVDAPHLALGELRHLAPHLGDPRRGLAGWFLALHRVLPDLYPLRHPVDYYLQLENPAARVLDRAVILPRLPAIYTWSAEHLGEPDLEHYLRNGRPSYALDRDVWWPASRATTPASTPR